MKKALIIYRGPLQRSRLRLIILAYKNVFEIVDFIWLLPNKKYHNENHKPFDEFISFYNLNSVKIIPGNLSKIFSCRKFLLNYHLSYNPDTIGLIGTSARFFIPKNLLSKIIWYINGIPEEKLIHSNSLKNKLRINVFWNILIILGSPKLIITVSENMGNYLKQYFPKSNFKTIPSTVPNYECDLDYSNKRYLAYSGSGAPWQWISKLECIWYLLHKINPTLEFKVISRDSRVKILGNRISNDKIKFISAKDSQEVFDNLKDCKAGFLIRQDHLINRVSSPIKFGEYLGAGCSVVTSQIEWSISDFVIDNNCGLLISTSEEDEKNAIRINDYLMKLSPKDYENAKSLSKQFDLDYNVDLLTQILFD